MEKFQFFGPPELDQTQKVENALQAYIQTLQQVEDGRIIANLPNVANYNLCWPEKQPDSTQQYAFYCFKRMPWGTKCSPSVLGCSLRLLFLEDAEVNPDHALWMKRLEDSTYVDDIPVTGNADAETIGNTKITRSVAKRGQFSIDKYKAYPPYFVEHFGLKPSTEPFKVLGLGFDPRSDCFLIQMKQLDQFHNQPRITKRQAASILARPFDPLGFGCPALMKAKELRQKKKKN